MAAVTGIEFLNKKFDPIGAKLDGWSESVMDNIIDYEEIFKKLHEKYSQKTSMPPELQLLVTLVGSGFMFHLTNSLFKSSLPGLGDVLKTNPDIMSNIMGAMGKAMNNSTPNSVLNQGPNSISQPINNKEFTSPSLNLSNMINASTTNLPSPPSFQNTPKQKPVEEEVDKLSVASSSDYSELLETSNSPAVTKGKAKSKITKGKSIKI